jgi:hypothetical protein
MVPLIIHIVVKGFWQHEMGSKFIGKYTYIFANNAQELTP